MASQTDLASLQGDWRFLVIETDGWRCTVNRDEAKTIAIEGDEWLSASPFRPGVTRVRFSLDTTRHRFDFQIAPDVVTPGIYCLDGKQLLICTNLRALRRALGHDVEGDERAPPSSLVAPAGSGFRLWILEKEPG
jgi:uncharacterized protein (TIGR03067 family)